MLLQPSNADRNDRAHKGGTKPRAAARGADGSKIEIRADELAVIFSKITVELGYLDKLGRLIGHDISFGHAIK